MDPATVAGLVLAAIPLLISAFENYEVTFQPFVTYCRHVKEVRRFTDSLDTQRAIFGNECQLIMLSLGQNLHDVLKDPDHPVRRDETLSNRLKEMLGSSYNTCITTLNLINDTLSEITRETKDFRYLLQTEKKGKSTFSLFRQKLKISFSKTRLNDSVGELRRYNDDLCKLSRQIRELAAHHSRGSQPLQLKSSIISHLKTTRQASARLYDILACKWSCDDNVEHVASMSLKIEEQCRHSSSKARFNLALACSQATASHLEPLWLAIESASSDSALLQSLAPVEASIALDATLQKMGATSRSVRFDLSSTSTLESAETTSQGTKPCVFGPQLDLFRIGKLCRYFHEEVKIQASGEPCAGFLERTTTFRHYVYPIMPTSRSESVRTLMTPISLKQILCKTAEEKRQQDWVEKLRLAKVLALAVLQFSNEWVPECWGSKDVYFYDAPGQSLPSTLHESPFTKVRLSSSKSNQVLTADNGPAGLATNSTLFSLGVVLIELGYDAPFEILVQEQDKNAKDPTTNNQVTGFITARRLGETVHKKLNMTYGRLVEKCLNCNFGVATKLEDVDLQSAVLVHVVNELDTCLKQWSDFNSLVPF